MYAFPQVVWEQTKTFAGAGESFYLFPHNYMTRMTLSMNVSCAIHKIKVCTNAHHCISLFSATSAISTFIQVYLVQKFVTWNDSINRQYCRNIGQLFLDIDTGQYYRPILSVFICFVQQCSFKCFIVCLHHLFSDGRSSLSYFRYRFANYYIMLFLLVHFS